MGLLAGGGRFPLAFAAAARQQGYEVYCMAILGMASEELEQVCTSIRFAPLARIGRAIRFFKRRDVDTNGVIPIPS